eukprot:5138535-Amphidinium_carterae.1
MPSVLRTLRSSWGFALLAEVPAGQALYMTLVSLVTVQVQALPDEKLAELALELCSDIRALGLTPLSSEFF